MNRPAPSHLLAVLVAAVALVGVTVPSSQAGPAKKVFHESLTVVPAATAMATSTTYSLRFLLTNDSRSPQAFGSAEILVPDGWTVGASSTDVAGFTATAGAGVVLVTSSGPTGSGIAPGSALTVTASVTTPSAAACRAAWPTFVKQSNDFSGSGNDFVAADAAPTTTVGGGSLLFSTGPHLTQWNTAMAPAPVVRALDPCGSTDTSFTGTVTVTDSASQLATGTSPAAVAGLATLSGLTFSDFGFSDTLTAAAAGFTSVTSVAFDVLQSVVPCAAGKSCSSGNLSDRGGTTLVGIDAATGPLADVLTTTVKGDPSVFGSCGQPAGSTQEPALGSLVTFNVTNRSKTVTMTLPRSYVNLIPNNGTPFMDICLEVPAASAFVDKFGHTVTTGLLPDCTTTRTTVCITSRGKNAGNEVISFVLPPGDPRGSWF
jgi:hypothetical protein